MHEIAGFRFCLLLSKRMLCPTLSLFIRTFTCLVHRRLGKERKRRRQAKRRSPWFEVHLRTSCITACSACTFSCFLAEATSASCVRVESPTTTLKPTSLRGRTDFSISPNKACTCDTTCSCSWLQCKFLIWLRAAMGLTPSVMLGPASMTFATPVLRASFVSNAAWQFQSVPG